MLWKTLRARREPREGLTSRCAWSARKRVRGGRPRCTSVSGGGEGGTHLLLALFVTPFTTHPFRDRAPFLLLLETPPTYGGRRVLIIMHVCTVKTIDARILRIPRRSTSSFHRRAFWGGVLYSLPWSGWSIDGVPL